MADQENVVYAFTGLTGVPSDEYAVNVRAGDTLAVTTTTPGDDPAGLGNDLDPLVELFDPDGQRVAENDDGASDGRNALLTYAETRTGTYTVRVSSAKNTEGEYVLSIGQHSGDRHPFEVVGTTPQNGDILADLPTAYRVDFSEGLLLSSVEAEDLIFDGIAADGVTIIDGDTLEFSLGPGIPQERAYTVEIPAAALLRYTASRPGTYTVRVLGTGGTQGESFLQVTPDTSAASVVARRVFYNNSIFDTNDPLANAADSGAIAYDKQALLPGESGNSITDTAVNAIDMLIARDNQSEDSSSATIDWMFEFEQSQHRPDRRDQVEEAVDELLQMWPS